MAGTRVPSSSRALSIFISAVSSEFKSDRDEMAELLRNYGVVHVQETYPTQIYSGRKIEELIEQADLIVCLIGFHFGYPYPDNDRPPEKKRSWTQVEYEYAREVVRAHPEKRLAAFMNYTTPDGALDERQLAFRKRISAAEEGTREGLFFAAYTGKEDLLKNLKMMIENPAGGFAAIQYSFWLTVRDTYRQQTVDKWRTTMPLSYTARTDAETRAVLMDAPDPPFIERREFLILNPNNGRQLEFLNPAAFLTGRDTNAELQARKNADWKSLSHGIEPALGLERSGGNKIIDVLCQKPGTPAVLGTVELPQPIRLFLVSGSGIGKSASLSWIEARLNGLPTGEGPGPEESAHLAVLLLAGDLVKVSAEQLLETVADHLIRKTIETAEPWHERAIRVGLTRDAQEGTLVLIIDGLDHVSNDLAFLMESQGSSALQGSWARCPIVVAGRPQALLNWRDRPGPRRGVVASHWRFIEPAQFTDDEAEVYLGSFDSEPRLAVVEDHLAGLLHVPRILEYVRTLNADQLRGARTASDIYFSATLKIVSTAMKSPAARTFGPNWEEFVDLDEPPREQIILMGKMLAALAFMSLCPTSNPAVPLDSNSFRMRLDEATKEELKIRLNGTQNEKPTRQRKPVRPKKPTRREMAELERDLKAVAAMTAVIGNGVLEDLSAQGSNTLDTVMWANRTVQQFFAALWVSYFGEGADEVKELLNGKSLVVSEEPTYDAQRMRHYVFFPETDMTNLRWDCEGCPNFARTDVTYEFNLFLAEMPRSAIVPKKWAAAASVWYDPALFSQEAGGMRLWSAEMLYRSWPMMIRLAGMPMDDWWDAPYQSLVAHPAGRPRYEISPHKDVWNEKPEPLAGLVLDRFLNHFEHQLKEDAGFATVARELIGDDQWVRVPDGNFVMGTPADVPQGVPTGKVDAYWKGELLDPVQLRQSTPLQAAEAGTWPEWFAPGGVGDKGREADIKWLRTLLDPLAREGAERGLTEPDRESAAYREALDEIEARFKTCDETPKENPQLVRGFEMNRFPTLHRWFWLFAPGHKRVVEAYLATLPDLSNVDPSRRLVAPPGHPPDDHPVTYTSWYDAWAFCQWANWRDEGSKTRMGLRLAHEPEWEFAARWHTEDGRPAPSPREWRWWWGNAFYSDENSLDAEIPSDPRAHADGRPGKTRAPAEAEPNGLGFYDILGNVWEWTATMYSLKRERDIWNEDRFTLRYSRNDPTERPPVNGQRTMRGGLWYYLSVLATSANRFRYVCNDRDFKVGFRVVREPKPKR